MSSDEHEAPGKNPEAKAEEASLYQLLVESVRDYAIFAIDPHGRVVTWNTGAERLKGYTREEIVGRHFSIFYPDKDQDAGKPAIALETAAREGRFEDEAWRVRKDGTPFWANVVITALHNSDGRLVGFAKVTRDLTERRLAEQRELANAKRVFEAESANRTKSQFLAAMSHELRTPLNAIGGYADLLRMGVRGELNGQQQEDIERIIASQRHLLGIINDLLNFSRIEAGKLTYDVADVAIRDVTDAVIAMIEPLAKTKNIEVQRGECAGSPVATGDREKVEQILINLTSNAVNYTEEGGWFNISCGTERDRVWVKVSDSGVGISPDDQESIFEPFVQVGRSFSTNHHGAGLGLAISRDLARGMGGDLGVESALEMGSTFTLWLPAASAAS